MVIRVPPGALTAMRTHAAEAYPEECCGGLIGVAEQAGERRVVEVVPVGNDRADSRARRYLIGPDAVRALEREASRHGLDLLGFYHSHPDHAARPSDFDRAHAWPWYSYLIVPVERGAAGAPRSWCLTDDRERFEEQTIVEDGAKP